MAEDTAEDTAAPNARRMTVVTICWYCYIGEHDRCCYLGHNPFGDPSASPYQVSIDCFCARIRHPAEMVLGGQSSAMYDTEGREVFR